MIRQVKITYRYQMILENIQLRKFFHFLIKFFLYLLHLLFLRNFLNCHIVVIKTADAVFVLIICM